MCEAFKELGYHVEVVSGPRRERLKRVFRLFLEGKPDRFLFCYSEPSTYPLNPVVDYPFYLFLAMHRIPTGIYYRDAYWKFPTWFPHHGIKGLMLQVRYRVDWWLFNKVASVLYFPSRKMTGLFSAKRPKVILPPGGKVVNQRGFLSPSSGLQRAIYVGGISENLGLNLLLGAVALVNERRPLRLHLVCKKDQFDRARSIFEKYGEADWLRVHHLAAPDLPPLYRESDFGIIPRLKDTYNDLTMPVKMFEYLSYGLPIVSTNCTEIANFIQSHQVGIVTQDNAESLAKGILELMADHGLYDTLCRSVPVALERGNLWVHRAQAVVEHLAPSPARHRAGLQAS